MQKKRGPASRGAGAPGRPSSHVNMRTRTARLTLERETERKQESKWAGCLGGQAKGQTEITFHSKNLRDNGKKPETGKSALKNTQKKGDLGHPESLSGQSTIRGAE